MKLICYLLITTVLFSCKKESAVVFPQTLYAKKIIKKTDVRLFINKVEIFNAAVINKFISNSTYFNFHTEPVSPDGKIIFINPDTALIGTTTDKLFIVKTGNQFLFNSPPMLQSDHILDGLFKYTGTKLRWPGGYITSIITVGYGSYSNLDISVLGYKLKYGTQSSFGGSAGIAFNEFDETYISKLGPFDTLAIQEYKYNFKAR